MNQRGNTLVGLLVTMVIMAMLAMVFMYGSGTFGEHKSARKDGKGTTIPGAAEMAAQDTVCRSNLNQVRQGLMIQQGGDDTSHPDSLAVLNFPKEVLHCPIGHEAYVYDPTTGTVHCPHPGHEKY